MSNLDNSVSSIRSDLTKLVGRLDTYTVAFLAVLLAKNQEPTTDHIEQARNLIKEVRAGSTSGRQP